MRPGQHAALFLIPFGMAVCVPRALVGQTSGRATSPPGKAAPSPEPPAQENAAERKAVRGSALPELDASETPELREVRRFEEQAFPRSGMPSLLGIEPDDAALPLPPALKGRWGGTGDIPRELRSPEAPTANDRAAGRPEWTQNLKLPDIPVRWAPPVLRYLEFFKSDNRGRAIMTVWLRKMERYRAVFDAILTRNEVPKDLIYLAMIESGFEPGATSNKNAGGVWQFMPAVARAYGLEVSHWVDGRRDPERAAEAAARYLKDLYVRFGSWHLAFAAYNAGYGAILRSIARYNTNDFWELSRHEAGLPWETTNYVPKILAAAIVGHNRAAFGFGDVPADAPWAYDTIQVPAGTSFTALARGAGTRPEVIEALNPELLRERVPPDRGPSMVRIPLGSSNLYAQSIMQLRSSGERTDSVVLRFGETLESVAKARGVSVRELKRLNGINDTVELRGGTTILVPARNGAPAPVANTSEDPDDTILVAVPERAAGSNGRERVFYRTREGDTLDDIADVFHVTNDELVDWNNLDPDARLQPKLVLQIFVREGFDSSGVVLLNPDKVRVVTLGSQEFLDLETSRRGKTRLQYSARAGDTLAKIAKRYGLAPGDLARINRLSATNELAEGQKVIVYSPTPELPKEITQRSSAAPKKPTPSKPPVLARGITAPSKTPARQAPAKVASSRKPAPVAPSAKPAGSSSKPSGTAAKSAKPGAPAGNGGQAGSKPATKLGGAPAAAKKPAPGKR